MKVRRMNDAERLRAQISTSTDPARLERMARAAEARDGRPTAMHRLRLVIFAAVLVGAVLGYCWWVHWL